MGVAQVQQSGALWPKSGRMDGISSRERGDPGEHTERHACSRLVRADLIGRRQSFLAGAMRFSDDSVSWLPLHRMQGVAGSSWPWYRHPPMALMGIPRWTGVVRCQVLLRLLVWRGIEVFH